jgi:hypothetical protein
MRSSSNIVRSSRHAVLCANRLQRQITDTLSFDLNANKMHSDSIASPHGARDRRSGVTVDYTNDGGVPQIGEHRPQRPANPAAPVAHQHPGRRRET